MVIRQPKPNQKQHEHTQGETSDTKNRQQRTTKYRLEQSVIKYSVDLTSAARTTRTPSPRSSTNYPAGCLVRLITIQPAISRHDTIKKQRRGPNRYKVSRDRRRLQARQTTQLEIRSIRRLSAEPRWTK